MPIFIETEEDNTTPTPRNFLDSPINPGDRFVGQTHGPAGMGMRAYMDRPETQPDWTPYDRSMGYTSPAHPLGQTQGPAGMGMNAYVNRPGPTILDNQISGITNPNLNGYKVMNALSMDPTADDFFLRELFNYGKRYFPGYDPENDEWRQKKYRDSLPKENEFPTYDPTNPNHFMMPPEGLPDDFPLEDIFNAPTMEAKIDLNEIFRMYPDINIWRLIQNLDARGIDYAANDRGIGSLDEYQMAELTQGQKDMMGNPLNTPDFGVSKQDLWGQVKDMEDKGVFGWGAQEPTTQEEYDDYYRQLQAGTVGNWVT